MKGDENMNANKLKGIMREKGVTQEVLAVQMNLSLQTLNSRLNGRSSFTIDEADKLIDLLDITDVASVFFEKTIPNMQ